MLDGMKGAKAKTGWFESAKYENGMPVAQIAALHENGAPSKNIPPRPFMRVTAAEKRDEWRGKSQQLSKGIVDGSTTAADVVELIAKEAEFDIRDTIKTLTQPALAESTIENRMRKRSSKDRTPGIEKPLMDTMTLWNTLTSTKVE